MSVSTLDGQLSTVKIGAEQPDIRNEVLDVSSQFLGKALVTAYDGQNSLKHGVYIVGEL